MRWLSRLDLNEFLLFVLVFSVIVVTYGFIKRQFGEKEGPITGWEEFCSGLIAIVLGIFLFRWYFAGTDIHFDFSALLLVAVIYTGIYTVYGKLRNSKLGEAYQERVVVEYCRSFFPVIFVVLVLRSFLAEPFRIPSESMLPTLQDGDFVLVNKFAYGLRAPVFHNKLLDLGEPERGDVVVFRYPHAPEVDYIKRVIGLPGDKIAWFQERLVVNGKVVPIEFVENYPNRPPLKVFQETNPEGREYQIMNDVQKLSPNAEYTVPAGHYYVMGDNRDHSNDSRYWGPYRGGGVVAERDLVGKAFFIWLNIGEWGRIGTSL